MATLASWTAVVASRCCDACSVVLCPRDHRHVHHRVARYSSVVPLASVPDLALEAAVQVSMVTAARGGRDDRRAALMAFRSETSC